MNPEDKAKELVDKFYQTTPNKSWFYPPNKNDIFNDSYNTWSQAKECALIAVEQVRFFHESLFYAAEGSLFDDYLIKVKHEIEQL